MQNEARQKLLLRWVGPPRWCELRGTAPVVGNNSILILEGNAFKPSRKAAQDGQFRRRNHDAAPTLSGL
jgi:hypothetical protein